MGTLGVLLVGVGSFVVGFFVSRANGEGTRLDKVADKVDEKWAAKIKPELFKLEKEIQELKNKIK